MQTIELTPGPQGETGPAGPQGIQGVPGADAPDRTADLCVLYQRLSEMSLIGNLTVPDYCTGVVIDADVDGFASPGSGGLDCDDTNPAVFPGAVEICGDGIDNDCDGIDEDCL